MAALHLPVAAQEAPFLVPRLSGPVEIDGRVDEAAWMAIPPLEVSASLPTFGRAPSERTEIRIAYDDTYLYVAGRMYDRDPGGIRATSLRLSAGALIFRRFGPVPPAQPGATCLRGNRHPTGSGSWSLLLEGNRPLRTVGPAGGSHCRTPAGGPCTYRSPGGPEGPRLGLVSGRGQNAVTGEMMAASRAL